MRIRVEAGFGVDLLLQMLRWLGQDQLACRPHRPFHQVATTDAAVAPTNIDMTMVAFAQFAGQGEDTCGDRPKLVLDPGTVSDCLIFLTDSILAAPGAASKHAAISPDPCAVRAADRRGNPDRVTMSIPIEESDFRIDRHQVRR
jgi:hypothetical protein